jgi:hypothetical protein
MRPFRISPLGQGKTIERERDLLSRIVVPRRVSHPAQGPFLRTLRGHPSHLPSSLNVAGARLIISRAAGGSLDLATGRTVTTGAIDDSAMT